MGSDSKITWITCPECGVKIGIVISVGRTTNVVERLHEEQDRIELPPSILDKFVAAGIDISLVTIEEEDELVTVTPKRFLGDLWGLVNDEVKKLGGAWVRQGRESRWEIRKEDLSA